MLDVSTDISNSRLGSVFGRLGEGNTTGEGTFLGVRGYTTQPSYVKSFAIGHSFYGYINSSINFFRGGDMTGGWLTFNTDDNTERMRITTGDNVGIGTTAPRSKLDIWGGQLNVTSTDYNGTLAAGALGGYAYIGCNNLTYSISISPSGNVGIGAINPFEHRLAVNGSAIFNKVVVKNYSSWPDYVFEPTYQLPSLDSVSAFIKENKHLPEMPSAAAVEKDGHDLGEVQKLLVKKVKELMLYVIEQQMQILELKKKMN
jgi:hypothetical protein